jgi:hypothetical protein
MQKSAGTIRSLKPNVSLDEALRHFTGGVRGKVSKALRGPARSVAELYIPYRLFKTRIENSGHEERRIYGLDAVEGVLDLFEFRELPGENEVARIKNRNALASRVMAEEAREQLTGKVRRLVFSRGFTRLRNLKIEVSAVEGDLLYIPYWVCFRGRDQDARVEVMDAVRRRPEGAKVRTMVEEWLRSAASDGTAISEVAARPQ